VALLGERLANEALDIIVTSDLQRARATGAAIARYHQSPVYEDAAIREIFLGAWVVLRCSTGDVEQTDHISLSFVPGSDGPGCRPEVYLAMFAFEVVGCLV
jgi:histidine phosphatase superfamily protein (branch 1)